MVSFADIFDPAYLVWLGGFLPLWMLATYVHELGHAGFGRLAGSRPRSVGSGIGGRAVSVRIRGVVYYQSLGGFSQGLTLCGMPGLSPDRWRTVVYTLGGIIANLVVGAVVGVVWRFLDGEPWWLSAAVGEFAAFNILSGLLNLLPFQVQVGNATVGTDGRGVINAVRRLPGPPIANTVNVYRVLQPLLTSIGDRHTLSALGSESARFWAMLGRPAFGRKFLTDGEPADLRPLDKALAAYARGWLAAAEGGHEVAEAELAEAGRQFVLAGDRAGQCLVALSRVDLLTDTGRYAEAQSQMDALDKPEWKQVGLKLDVVRELIAAKTTALTGDAAAADRLLELVESATVDPAVRVALMREVGEVFARAGLWPQAERAERLCAKSVSECAAVLTDPADKAEIELTHNAVWERVRAAVAAQAKEPDPESAELDTSAAVRAKVSQQNVLWWWAVGLAAAVLVCGIGGLVALVVLPTVRDGELPPLTKPIVLAFTLVFAPAWWVVVQGIEWGWAKLRRKPRTNYGTSAMVGWVIIILVVPLAGVYAMWEEERRPTWRPPPPMTAEQLADLRRQQIEGIRKALAEKEWTPEQRRALEGMMRELEKQPVVPED
jgi:hypothetical protein